jgi:hypothetical protein
VNESTEIDISSPKKLKNVLNQHNYRIHSNAKQNSNRTKQNQSPRRFHNPLRIKDLNIPEKNAAICRILENSTGHNNQCKSTRTKA